MSEGYIRLQRSIINWEWVDDPNTLRLWIQLLCTANWKPAKYKGIDVGPGQRVASLTQLADEMGMSVDMVRTGKKHLCSTGEITCKRTQYGDLITIENWAKYQIVPGEVRTENPTENPNQIPRNFPEQSHAIEEEREEYKNNIKFARTPAGVRMRAHTHATNKEEKWDVNDGREVQPGIWLPNHHPVTDEDKIANYHKVREVFRASLREEE